MNPAPSVTSSAASHDAHYRYKPYVSAWSKAACETISAGNTRLQARLDEHKEIGHVWKYVAFNSAKSFRVYAKHVTNNIEVITLAWRDADCDLLPPFGIPMAGDRAANRAGGLMITNREIGHIGLIILIWPSDNAALAIAQAFSGYGDDVQCDHSDEYHKAMNFLDNRETHASIVEELPYIYHGTQKELAVVLADKEFPMYNIVLMGIYRFYPWVREALSQHVQIRFASAFVPSSSASFHTPESVSDALAEQVDELIFPIILLQYFYKSGDTMAVQTFRRYRAAVASSTVRSHEQAHFESIISMFNLEPTPNNSLVDWAFGNLLAIGKDEKWNPDIKGNDLVTAEEICTKYKLTDFHFRLYAQLRMIAEHHASTSVKLTADHFSFVAPIISELHDELAQEVARFNNVIQNIRECPFVGLRKTQKDDIQVAKFPCLVWLCVKYHMDGLPDPERAEMEEKYALRNIQDKIKDPTLKAMLNTIVETALRPKLDQLLTIIQNMQAEKAANYLATATQDRGEELLRYMQLHNKECPWRTYAEKLAIDAYAGPLYRDLEDQAMTLVDNSRKYLLQGLGLSSTSELGLEMRKYMRDALDQMAREYNPSESKLFKLSEAPSDSLNRYRNELATLMSERITLIMDHLRELANQAEQGPPPAVPQDP